MTMLRLASPERDGRENYVPADKVLTVRNDSGDIIEVVTAKEVLPVRYSPDNLTTIVNAVNGYAGGVPMIAID